MELKTREPSPVEVNSIPGQAEKKLERTQADWRRRCEGATMMSLAKVFGLAVGAIHNYIETMRKQLRKQTVKLAAQEREQSL